MPGQVLFNPSIGVVMTAILPSNATGTVTVCWTGVDYESSISEGRATFSIPLSDGDLGNFCVDMFYSGDEHYNEFSTAEDISVIAVEAIIGDEHDHIVYYDSMIDDQSVNYGDQIYYYLSDAANGINETFAFPDVTGTCYVVLNDVQSDPVEIINGKAIIDIIGLSKGDYTPIVYYSGDEQYLAKSIVGELFTVKSRTAPIG